MKLNKILIKKTRPFSLIVILAFVFSILVFVPKPTAALACDWDDYCDPGERASQCPDCWCGDDICDSSESSSSCPDDCGPSCSNECASGTTQCISGGIKQTCADYNGDGCTEWGGDTDCGVNGCYNGECKYGVWLCAEDIPSCSSYHSYGCGKQDCGLNALDCLPTEQCRQYLDCDLSKEGVKACYLCVFDKSCCIEGMIVVYDWECTDCNSNWYLSSGYCCRVKTYWSGAACLATQECYNAPCGSLPFTTTWWNDPFCVTSTQACCKTSQYGSTEFYDWVNSIVY